MLANQSTRLKYDTSEKFIWDKEKILKVFTTAAKKFVHKKDNKYVIHAASRDWFLEPWGRDTFISLPGLLLAIGRFKEAKGVITSFAEYEKNGIIPNRIVSVDEILYNTADASLWFVQAVKKYMEYTQDADFLKEILPTIKKIVDSYKEGTGYERDGIWYDIKMDDDGLILSPAQATWMDADPSFQGTYPITPRHGKAVEINALWYATLTFLISVMPTSEVKKYRALAKKVKTSFRKKFWNAQKKSLYDVIEGDVHGDEIRPNMVFAVSHGEDLLLHSQQKSVFQIATQHLLTPGGLRTLSPKDKHYHGVYDTALPPEQKDLAYHQGTVWPWLMGSYMDALIRIRGYEKKSKRSAQNEIKKLLTPLVRFCLESRYKSLPEVFSGDEPYEPGGTTSQAWSVGEVLRALVEHKLL